MERERKIGMIPVVFITDENFIMQTVVAMTSLYYSKKAETEYDVYVVTADCAETAKRKFKRLEKKDMRVNIVEASLEEYRDIKQLAHIPIACLLKFNICDLVSSYEKIIYLDGDICVRNDLSDLYDIDLGECFAGGVPSLEMLSSDKRMINAGIMLFNASKMRAEHMAERLVAERKKLGDRGSMDQQTFNMVLGDQILFLPPKFNCIADKFLGDEKRIFKLDKVNKLYGTGYASFKELVDDAVIIHFASGMKPWKFSFIPCADEWYRAYKASVYRNVELKRKNLLQARVTGMKNQLKKNGVKGFVKRLGEHIGYWAGKGKIKNWG